MASIQVGIFGNAVFMAHVLLLLLSLRDLLHLALKSIAFLEEGMELLHNMLIRFGIDLFLPFDPAASVF